MQCANIEDVSCKALLVFHSSVITFLQRLKMRQLYVRVRYGFELAFLYLAELKLNFHMFNFT